MSHLLVPAARQDTAEQPLASGPSPARSQRSGGHQGRGRFPLPRSPAVPQSSPLHRPRGLGQRPRDQSFSRWPEGPPGLGGRVTLTGCAPFIFTARSFSEAHGVAIGVRAPGLPRRLLPELPGPVTPFSLLVASAF